MPWFLTAPGAPPRDLTVTSLTARSVVLSWSTIECIERNGVILGYQTQLTAGGIPVPGDTNNVTRTFTASGLTPFTPHQFSVGGINSVGPGPNAMQDFTTMEDGNDMIIIMLKLHYVRL